MAMNSDRTQRIKTHVSLTTDINLKFTSEMQPSNMNYAASIRETPETRKQRIMEHAQRTRG